MKKFVVKHREKFKTLSNLNRIKILYGLYEKSQRWSDLMYDHRINPKSLKDHLNHLLDRKYIKETEKIYSLTRKGRDLCELKFMIKVVEHISNSIKEAS